jgi:hypothetical protein
MWPYAFLSLGKAKNVRQARNPILCNFERYSYKHEKEVEMQGLGESTTILDNKLTDQANVARASSFSITHIWYTQLRSTPT